ncbi:MAG: glycosyltransferase [Gammaproteobacteria bacterium]|nr:MAG: glycosyltransferase [Gammaproteobacteria bacterium]
MNKESAIIFRKQILPYSETFIAAQGKFLKKYSPLFTGLTNNNTGREMLGEAPCFVLEDYTKNLQVSKFLNRRGILNKNWLNDIKQHSPKIIHAHFLKDGMDALALKEKLSIPLITTLHGHDITKKEKKSIFSKSRAHFFQQVDKVIAVSDYIYKHAVNNGCPEDKLVTHFIGIDVEKFDKPRDETTSPTLLFVGRLVEKKGCIYLLRAMKTLSTKYPELKLTIVGEGNLYHELHHFVATNKLNVEFVGRETAEQIRDRLTKAWVFVAPSITANNGDAEGLGMVFLEAQALKVPIVSFRSGGITQAIEHEKTGLLCDEKDISSLSEYIAYFLNSETERIKTGSQGRQRVEKYFDVRKQCGLLDNIYDSIR